MPTINEHRIQASGVIEGDPVEVGHQLFTKLVLPAITVMHEKGGPDVSRGAFAGLLAATFAHMAAIYGVERGALMSRSAVEAFEEAQAVIAAELKH